VHATPSSALACAYTRTHYGTGYYIFDRFVTDLALTHPLQSWNEASVPDQRVLEFINRAGSDIAPRSGVERITKAFDLSAGGSTAVAALKGNGTIRAVEFSIPRDQAPEFKYVRLRMTWDNRKQPSVDTPIALFYGAGTLYNRDNRTFLVKAFPVNIRFTEDRVYLACYFSMPFSRAARIELVGGRSRTVGD